MRSSPIALTLTILIAFHPLMRSFHTGNISSTPLRDSHLLQGLCGWPSGPGSIPSCGCLFHPLPHHPRPGRQVVYQLDHLPAIVLTPPPFFFGNSLQLFALGLPGPHVEIRI
ncbi:hypothetical protein QBC42DRAFT_27401 [Cladorrhinum samala]|uniref:Secreted protein n=1 Tax=Cladorrhinum samala TaxID=585594 RepID=A0AAV9HEX6_9PEZI|nr:hypothetical protein QBC42DRAFT_27401 [Cladorrhinum samala]